MCNLTVDRGFQPALKFYLYSYCTPSLRRHYPDQVFKKIKWSAIRIFFEGYNLSLCLCF